MQKFEKNRIFDNYIVDQTHRCTYRSIRPIERIQKMPSLILFVAVTATNASKCEKNWVFRKCGGNSKIYPIDMHIIRFLSSSRFRKCPY
ncbi:MAG: hypothetical protein GY820_09180 [Gammaproteobacteria bacterium]|nr:hypothetical protein [Gammaproteobacteria bacterium]